MYCSFVFFIKNDKKNKKQYGIKHNTFLFFVNPQLKHVI